MKRVYLIRYGAFGDHLHMSHCIRAFKEEGYHVSFEYNWKGAQIHAFNPYIDNHVYNEPSKELYEGTEKARYQHYKRLEKLKKEYDKVVDFTLSLESSLIAGGATPHYFLPKKTRNKIFGQICFHDQSVKWAGLPSKYYGGTSEVYYRKKEHDRMKEIFQPIRDKKQFILIWSLAGSMWQKAIYPWSKEVCDEFQRRHPDVFVVVTAGKEYKDSGWEGDNVMNVIDKYPFRQILLATKYANALVTPETGLGIGAGAYGTPKIMLMTAASIKNIVGNDKNDFSMQADVWCSPCHRAIYDMDTCQTIKVDKEVRVAHGDNDRVAKELPICVFFDKEKVLNQLEKIYELRHMPQWDEPPGERLVYM